ncbi:hypothetical protein Tco_0698059 [Tanacetum coccineum]
MELEANAARHNLLLLLKVNVARHKLTNAVEIKVKTANREVQLQSPVDGKKIIITKASVRCDLQLNDEEGMDCLPNATIFEELTRIGAKTTACNEFSSTMASAITCLATNQKFNFSKYIFESMVKNLENVSGKFLMYPRFVQVFLEKQLEGMSNHKRIYVTPSYTKKIFRNIRRVWKGFSGKETPLFPTMMVQAQEEMGEGSANLTDPHHTPTIIQPSTSQPQRKQKPRKLKRKDTKVPQPSGPTNNVADEAVYEEMDNSLERAATTATSLDAEQDKGNINKTQSKATLNEPSSLGTSSGSGLRRQETMGDTIAQTGFENVSKTSNDLLLAGVGLSRRVESSEDKGLGEEDASKQGRIADIDDDAGINLVIASKDVNLSVDEVTLAQALAALKSAKLKADKVMLQEPEQRIITTTATTTVTAASTRPKAKGLVIHKQEQAPTPTVSSQQPSQLNVQDKGKGKMVEPEPVNKLSKKDQLMLDEELAFKLQAELEEEDRLIKSGEIKVKSDPANVNSGFVVNTGHFGLILVASKLSLVATILILSSRPTTLVADETVHVERGDSIERAATTAASLDAEQDSGTIIRTQSMAHLMSLFLRELVQVVVSGAKIPYWETDLLKLGVNTPGSGEDRLKIMELIEICTKLSDRVLALENVKTAQDLEITSLKKRVKKLEKKKKARTPQLKRRLFKGRNIAESDQDEEISFVQEDVETQGRYDQDIEVTTASAPITTAGVSVSTAEPSTPPPTTTTVIEDEDLTIAQTLMTMRSEKSKEKAKERGSKEKSSEPATRPTRGVTMQEPSESGTRKAVPPSQHDLKDKGKAKMIEPKKPLKKKDQIKFDEEVAKRLAEELEAELDEEERVTIQREEDANLISWDNTQAMMEADYELAQRLQAKEQGELTIEERSRLFVELMDKRKKHFAKLRAEKIRRKPPTKAQKRNQMSTYLRNMAGYKHTQLKNKSFEEIQMLFDKEMKRVNSFVPMDSEVVEGSGKKTESSRKETVSKKRAGEELDEESVKRQKLEDDAEKAELQLCLEIVPRDDEAVNVFSWSARVQGGDGGGKVAARW